LVSPTFLMFSFKRSSEKKPPPPVVVEVPLEALPESAPVPVAMFAKNCACW